MSNHGLVEERSYLLQLLTFSIQGESEVNHVLSFCRYIQSLPDTSERLPSTLNVLEPLVHGLWSGLRPDDASGSTGRMGKHLVRESGFMLKLSVYTLC